MFYILYDLNETVQIIVAYPIYRKHVSMIFQFYFRFKGVATIDQLKRLSEINWYELKEFELVKVIKFNDTDIFVLHAFTLNLMFNTENEKTIKLSTSGLKRQIRRNNWNLVNYKHSKTVFKPIKGVNDRAFIPFTKFKSDNGMLLFNNVNYQMLVVDEQIRMAHIETKKVKVLKFKGNIQITEDRAKELIKSDDPKFNEAYFYDISYRTETVDNTISNVKKSFEIDNQKNEVIRKATKGVKFKPSLENVRNYAISNSYGAEYTLASLIRTGDVEIEPFFLFDLFRDNFVGVNYVASSNTLYFDYLDYSEKMGRSKVLELIKKVELLVNIAYPNINLNVVLNIHTIGSACRRLEKDSRIKDLKKSIIVKYKEFDYSL